MKPSCGICILTALALLLSFLTACAEEAQVYITETGRKYHLDGCPYLQRSRIPIVFSEAGALGYEPCGHCNPPPPPAGALTPRADLKPELYRLNVAELRSYRDADLDRMTRAVVVRHVDGDTVYMSIPRPPASIDRYESVRLIGVDTPETVHPQKPVERFGEEASSFTRDRLLNRTVYLAYDWELRDRYGRLLAYVYLPDSSCHNADMIREGYSHAYTRFPFQFLEEFRALESRAREQYRSLWGPDS